LTIEGYALKAGSLAIFGIYNVHHHPEFWPEPEQFYPDRFFSTESHRFSYIPFGSGERICIGNHFAMLESRLLLSMIVNQHAKITRESEKSTLKTFQAP
jgi:cytochrome P450